MLGGVRGALTLYPEGLSSKAAFLGTLYTFVTQGVLGDRILTRVAPATHVQSITLCTVDFGIPYLFRWLEGVTTHQRITVP